MTTGIYNTIQALTDVSLKRENGTLLVLPTASGSVFNPGITMQDIMATSRTGEQVIVGRYSRERKPELQLDFQQKSIQLLGLRLGQQWEELTTTTGYIFNSGFRVTAGEIAGAAAGAEGFGMLADQVGSKASVLNTNQTSTPLTRQPFDTFDPVTDDTFAQGANGALKFSNNLIGRYVAYELPYELTNIIGLSDLPDIRFSMRAMTMMTDRTLIEWEFPSISVKLDGGEINMNDPAMQLSFQVQDDGSTCIPYRVKYKGEAQLRKCIAE